MTPDPGPLQIQASIARDMLIGFVATIAVIALLACIAVVAMQGEKNWQHVRTNERIV